MKKLSEILKNIAYVTLTKIVEKSWKLIKPRTHGARILLTTRTHALLVQRRATNRWNLPGGGISKTEDPAKGALRELYEETGIIVEGVDFLLGTYFSSSEGKKDTIYIVVKKIENPLDAKISFEIQDAKWFPLNNLPETTTSATFYRIDEYLSSKRNIQGKWTERNS